MAVSTFDPSRARARHAVCPHCGHSVDPRLPATVETGLGILAALVLVLMLAPLAVIVWKSCSDYLSNKVSHSIFYHPLEEWTPY
jgi:hypothetical protein